MDNFCFRKIKLFNCYRNVEEFRVETDREEGVRNYVQMEDPISEQISFVQVPCPGKNVLHLTCKDAGKMAAELSL